MSKYYKADDVIRAIAEQLCWEARTEYGDKFTTEDWLEEAEDYVLDLPTIEVSEDCISREYILSKVYDMDNDDLVVDLKDIENAPSVVPTADNLSAVEDCISREGLLKSFGLSEKTRKYGGDHSGYNTMMLYEIQDYIEDAPSVVPSRAEGEWKRHPIPESRAWDVCTACGTGCRRRHYGFNEDGTEWVEQANYPFCPNCGSRMRGEHNDE